jgi:hypothetical protein
MLLWLHELLNKLANLETKSALETAARAAAAMRNKLTQRSMKRGEFSFCMMEFYRYNNPAVRDPEKIGSLPGQIIQNSLIGSSVCGYVGNVLPKDFAGRTDDEHRSSSLPIREEVVHTECFGNHMLTVGQNGKRRFSFLNGACSLILWLNSQGNDLGSLFFKLGVVSCQPTELAKAEPSSVVAIKNQDDLLVILQLIGQTHHVSFAVRQSEVGS